jgi:reactive intermediate/imine deaminase
MAGREIIAPKDLHPAVGYSHATRKGNLLFVSGQIALDKDGNIVGEGDFRAQAEQVFKNLATVIESAGGSVNNIMKTTTFLTDLSNRPALAEVREKFYRAEPPASTLVVISSLVRPELMIEVEAIVALD